MTVAFFVIGVRYNTVEATQSLSGLVATTAARNFDVKIDRTSVSAGWFLTKNVLLKGEYVFSAIDISWQMVVTWLIYGILQAFIAVIIFAKINP
jgi:hypothetical protein